MRNYFNGIFGGRTHIHARTHMSPQCMSCMFCVCFRSLLKSNRKSNGIHKWMNGYASALRNKWHENGQLSIHPRREFFVILLLENDRIGLNGNKSVRKPKIAKMPSWPHTRKQTTNKYHTPSEHTKLMKCDTSNAIRIFVVV